MSYLSERQYGLLSHRRLLLKLKNSASITRRLKLSRTLDVHRGCVNTICWNDSGSMILSGSDDQHLIVTDPYTSGILSDVHSGHRENIFSAKFLPQTNDRRVVSCSGDGVIFHTDFDRPSLTHGNDGCFTCHGASTAYEVRVFSQTPNLFLSCSGRRFFDDSFVLSRFSESSRRLHCSLVRSPNEESVFEGALQWWCADPKQMGNYIDGCQSNEFQRNCLRLFGFSKYCWRYISAVQSRVHSIVALVCSSVWSSKAVDTVVLRSVCLSSMRSIHQRSSLSFCSHRSQRKTATTRDISGIQSLRNGNLDILLIWISLFTQSETESITRTKSSPSKRAPSGETNTSESVRGQVNS